ncbi:MAG: hypothetical protein RR547_10865 [Raoultibacter sp.]
MPPNERMHQSALPPNLQTHSPAVRPARANTSQGRKRFRPVDAFVALGALIILGIGIAATGIAYQSFIAASTDDDSGATAILTSAEQQQGASLEEVADESAQGENQATSRPGGYSGDRSQLKIALQSNPDKTKVAKDYVKVFQSEGFTVDLVGPFPYDHTLVVYRYPELEEEAQYIAGIVGASKCFRSYTENRTQYDADILVSLGPAAAPAPIV